MQVSAGQCAPKDACSNIAGNQASVPDGMEVQDGKCEKQVDLCENIAGDQEKTGEDVVRKDGDCLKVIDLNFVDPEMELVAPRASQTGKDLGNVELDETQPKTLASGPEPKVDNPLFPWLPAWLLALLILVPLVLALTFLYLAVHRPRLRARAAAATAPADPLATQPMPAVDPAQTQPMIIDDPEDYLLPPSPDGPPPDNPDSSS
jgi:hypothetical protein